MTKYEKLIEYIVNDQEEQARQLFHQIIVEKSREIYESMMDESDLYDNVGGDPVGSMVDSVTDNADEMDMDAGEMDADAEDMDMDADDMDMDSDEMDMDAEEMDSDAGELEDRVMDLESMVKELSAEFAEIMGDKSEDDMDADEDSEEEDLEDEEEDEADEEEDFEGEEEEDLQEGHYGKKHHKGHKGKKSDAEQLREYVDTIGDIYGQEPAKGEGKEVGSGGKSVKPNTKSMPGPGADMGGKVVKTGQGGPNPDPSGTPSDKPSGVLTDGGNLPHAGKFRNAPKTGKGGDAFKTAAPKPTNAEKSVNDRSPVNRKA